MVVAGTEATAYAYVMAYAYGMGGYVRAFGWFGGGVNARASAQRRPCLARQRVLVDRDVVPSVCSRSGWLAQSPSRRRRSHAFM